MKKVLFNLFPFLSVFASTDDKGISMSEASRQKNDNSNEINPVMGELLATPVTQTERAIYNNRTAEFKDYKVTGSALEPNLNLLKDINSIRTLKEANAFLGSAVASFDIVRKELLSIDTVKIAEACDIEVPVNPNLGYPALKRIGIGYHSVDQIIESNNIETIMRNVCEDVVTKCADLFVKGLSAEASAAHYGKLINGSDSLMNRISVTPHVVGGKLKEGTIICSQDREVNVYKEYDKINNTTFVSDFVTAIKAEYDKYQKQTNACLKQIKDVIRETAAEYQAEYDAAVVEHNKIMNRYNEAVAEYNAQINAKRNELQKELATLKIKA